MQFITECYLLYKYNAKYNAKYNTKYNNSRMDRSRAVCTLRKRINQLEINEWIQRTALEAEPVLCASVWCSSLRGEISKWNASAKDIQSISITSFDRLIHRYFGRALSAVILHCDSINQPNYSPRKCNNKTSEFKTFQVLFPCYTKS